VEAVFEGEQDAVESMLEFARRGPRGARVADVDAREEAPEGLTRFEVR
jgi:acylphosphatase